MRLCALDLGEDGWRKIKKWEHLPNNWPDHFDAVIFLLNNCILRALDHTPNELFFTIVINTVKTRVETVSAAITMDDIDMQQAYTGQQCFNGYTRAVKHWVAQKAVFYCRVLDSSASEVIFEASELVQVLDPKYKKTFLTSKKILPEWSGMFRVKECICSTLILSRLFMDRNWTASTTNDVYSPCSHQKGPCWRRTKQQDALARPTQRPLLLQDQRCWKRPS
jgi:hypothetical protein